jgi:hypothetical protein
LCPRMPSLRLKQMVKRFQPVLWIVPVTCATALFAWQLAARAPCASVTTSGEAHRRHYLAEQAAERKRAIDSRARLVTALTQARLMDRAGVRILQVAEGAEPSEVKVVVADSWLDQPRRDLYRAARKAQRLWASIHLPDDPASARITVVDGKGRRLGGSTSGIGTWVNVADYTPDLTE